MWQAVFTADKTLVEAMPFTSVGNRFANVASFLKGSLEYGEMDEAHVTAFLEHLGRLSSGGNNLINSYTMYQSGKLVDRWGNQRHKDAYAEHFNAYSQAFGFSTQEVNNYFSNNITISEQRKHAKERAKAAYVYVKDVSEHLGDSTTDQDKLDAIQQTMNLVLRTAETDAERVMLATEFQTLLDRDFKNQGTNSTFGKLITSSSGGYMEPEAGMGLVNKMYREGSITEAEHNMFKEIFE